MDALAAFRRGVPHQEYVARIIELAHLDTIRLARSDLPPPSGKVIPLTDMLLPDGALLRTGVAAFLRVHPVRDVWLLWLQGEPWPG